MKGFNLLPWREELREEKKKEFWILFTFSCIAALGLIVFFHLFISYFINREQMINNYLQQQIDGLDVQIQEIKDLKKQKQQMLTRMELIQQLESNRPQIVSLFILFTKVVPPGVYYNSITRESNLITLVGKAQSNIQVSDLMENIEKYNWMSIPMLSEIKSDDADFQYNKVFTIKVTQKKYQEN